MKPILLTLILAALCTASSAQIKTIEDLKREYSIIDSRRSAILISENAAMASDLIKRNEFQKWLDFYNEKARKFKPKELIENELPVKLPEVHEFMNKGLNWTDENGNAPARYSPKPELKIST